MYIYIYILHSSVIGIAAKNLLVVNSTGTQFFFFFTPPHQSMKGQRNYVKGALKKNVFTLTVKTVANAASDDLGNLHGYNNASPGFAKSGRKTSNPLRGALTPHSTPPRWPCG